MIPLVTAARRALDVLDASALSHAPAVQQAAQLLTGALGSAEAALAHDTRALITLSRIAGDSDRAGGISSALTREARVAALAGDHGYAHHLSTMARAIMDRARLRDRMRSPTDTAVFVMHPGAAGSR